ncbi:flavodoxin domain-containing protein [Anaeromicropila populeti]|uniref:Protoporphyrinogen IX oxidase, menaquinone-dependent (Flavodoxin domain) n=1 Tax=Anaeromicropila populeti TaxID=37658 RepID=A0A1I6IW15_9FIRM|nr:flavodoxin domain-containing protein [Anaeromicropila populeti]SFR70942.1 Protoporphyrinogen IX oxidase, menaquinone-dependent (flavodoxin domain) [Anaeromicropila populeti]
MENNIVVVYNSKTGFVRKYAEWISEELECNLLEGRKVGVEDLLQYRTVIYGGGLYATGINGVGLIRNNLETLKKKNLIIFASGSTPAKEKEIAEIWRHNFSQNEMKHIELFYMRGGFDFNKLSLPNKLRLFMMKMKIQNNNNPSEKEKIFLDAFTRPVDFTSKKNIEPLIKYVRALSS